MEDYLQQSWSGKITFVLVGTDFLDENGNAYLDIAGTSADALGTSAIVCATGPRKSLLTVNGDLPKSTERKLERTELLNIFFKMCSGAMVVPMLGSTTTTPLIYEITNVTS